MAHVVQPGPACGSISRLLATQHTQGLCKHAYSIPICFNFIPAECGTTMGHSARCGEWQCPGDRWVGRSGNVWM